MRGEQGPRARVLAVPVEGGAPRDAAGGLGKSFATPSGCGSGRAHGEIVVRGASRKNRPERESQGGSEISSGYGR